ncbi:unnamed protein product [Adineta ricciae]|uniref:RRM domain-containing protein n=1 Tax=Adineta ricciae TaxID=249248 RepID=A0A815Z774_ADIRI|nr:unnamed protein product [Adineta ricciae]
MNRNYYNLYVSNISSKTNRESLLYVWIPVRTLDLCTNKFCFSAFFSQFGKIENFKFFTKCSRRPNAAAMITFAEHTDIDYIIQHYQHVQFDTNSLSLRRTLPTNRPAFERFRSSNELLVSLPSLSTDQEFTETSMRQYFSRYGSVVFCRTVIPLTTYLIDFVDLDSVNRAIVEEPHFYNDQQLVLRKYVSLNRAELYHTSRNFSKFENTTDRFYLKEGIRRLNDTTEVIRFAQQVELRLIKRTYEAKHMKLYKKQNESLMDLTEKLSDLKAKIRQIENINNSLELLLQQSQQTKRQMIDYYEDKLKQERQRIDQLNEAINLLAVL